MEHYYSKEPKVLSKEKKIFCTINGKQFSFFTDNGVFAKNKLDLGTNILLNHLDLKKDGKILDLGCGYGPIGIFLATFFNTEIDMVDINERSLALAKKILN